MTPPSLPETPHTPPARSPAPALLLGLVITLAAVVAYSGYITWQISGLRLLQSELVDRNRRDSLQLLRIQNDLNLLGLAMRDMLDNDGPYPLTAWSAQFERIRLDLEDALRLGEAVSVAARTPGQRQYFANAVAQFWDAADRTFALAQDGDEDEARAQIQLSLQARQASLSASVARLLVENNAIEEETAMRVGEIYGQVQRQVYWFLGGTLMAIAVTSLYLIRSNRRLFAEMATLSDGRRELAQKLIATRESTLQQISRELHDEFGQTLTAIGSMLGRVGKHAPAGSTLRADLREIGETAQATLERMRSLSQTLHPSILDDLGLESAIEWYVSTTDRQLGVTVAYERRGPGRAVPSTVAIHVYRVLQEALSNVTRHSGVDQAWVRLRFEDDRLVLEVEDHGRGAAAARSQRGLGIVTMRERAGLLDGRLELEEPPGGGTLVRLSVPLGRSDRSV